MTLLDYYNTPESVAPQELIFGAMRVADAPFVSHQRIVLRMAIALDAHAQQFGGEVIVAPMDVVLDERRALVVQPDLLYVSGERAAIVGNRVYGAPDLVVEILSPHPRIGRIDEKIRWFTEYGVREIWVYQQVARRLRVLACDHGTVVDDQVFGPHDRIESRVLPAMATSTGAMGL